MTQNTLINENEDINLSDTQSQSRDQDQDPDQDREHSTENNYSDIELEIATTETDTKSSNSRNNSCSSCNDCDIVRENNAKNEQIDTYATAKTESNVKKKSSQSTCCKYNNSMFILSSGWSLEKVVSGHYFRQNWTKLEFGNIIK